MICNEGDDEDELFLFHLMEIAVLWSLLISRLALFDDFADRRMFNALTLRASTLTEFSDLRIRIRQVAFSSSSWVMTV
jgi:hypothetical protein